MVSREHRAVPATGAQMTRAELEARRLSAIPDLQGDVLSASAIAKRYGVSRVTVYRWQNAIIANGEDGLKARRTPGRPPRMTPDQIRMLRAIWKDGPGPGFDHWTARRFTEAIQQHIDIEFSHDHVGRIMHRLGLVPTKQKEARP
jgi:transposase